MKKLNEIHIYNFGSIREFSYKFDTEGLVGIDGATGSGKSTLFNAICWGLFGELPKKISVGEVIRWRESETKVIIKFNGLTVTRIRSNKKSDLYYNNEIRGSNLLDTQNIIENKLGLNYDAFCIGTYINSSSITTTFFNASLTNRMVLLNILANINYIEKIIENSVLLLKELDKNYNELLKNKSIQDNKLKSNENYKIQSINNYNSFDSNKQKNIQRIESEIELEKESIKEYINTFIAQNNSEIKELEEKIIELSSYLMNIGQEKCPTCGVINSEYIENKIKLDNYNKAITIAYNKEIPKETSKLLISLGTNLKRTIEEINPFEDTIKKLQLEELVLTMAQKKLKIDIETILHEIKATNNLIKYATLLRDVEIENSLKYIEEQSNYLLESIFNAPFKLELSYIKNDIKFVIYVDGNECSFDQLSKGQQTLLKLVFATSVIKRLENYYGSMSGVVLFDEALDGLDFNYKYHAINLFKELSLLGTTIYIIDHSDEIKLNCDYLIKVSLINGESKYEVDR